MREDWIKQAYKENWGKKVKFLPPVLVEDALQEALYRILESNNTDFEDYNHFLKTINSYMQNMTRPNDTFYRLNMGYVAEFIDEIFVEEYQEEPIFDKEFLLEVITSNGMGQKEYDMFMAWLEFNDAYVKDNFNISRGKWETTRDHILQLYKNNL